MAKTNQPSSGRIPPSATDIEGQILGAMLTETDAVARATEVLDEEAFYDDRHRKIFKAAHQLFKENKPVDLITLTETLQKNGNLSQVGGAPYLAELTNKVTSAANVEYHAKIIQEKSMLRQMITAFGGIAARAYSPSEDVFSLLDEAEKSVFNIQERKKTVKQPEAIKKLSLDMADIMERLHSGERKLLGIGTGFRVLDTWTLGMEEGDLWVIAGRPSMGKSAMVNCIEMFASQTVPVLTFTPEMTATQKVMRYISLAGNINHHILRKGKYTDDDWRTIMKALAELSDRKLFVDDTGSLGLAELKSKIVRYKAKYGIRVVVVDYLQKMKKPPTFEQREEAALGEITGDLKALAKELGITIILLSQFSRETEKADGKRPTMSHLRGSGQIEQDADVIVLLYRPEKYNIKTYDGEDTKGLAVFILDKQRNGTTGDIKMKFDARQMRFTDFPEPEGIQDEETPF